MVIIKWIVGNIAGNSSIQQVCSMHCAIFQAKNTEQEDIVPFLIVHYEVDWVMEEGGDHR